jgi:hypothetical protein
VILPERLLLRMRLSVYGPFREALPLKGAGKVLISGVLR